MRHYLKITSLGVIRPIGVENITDYSSVKPFLGTLRYSSPEYLLRNEEDTVEGWRALTFYQLGAVLHDMIMKYPLFNDRSNPYTRLVNAVINEIPEITVRDVDSDIYLLAKQCLLKDPALRSRYIKWEDFSFPKKNDEDLGQTKSRIKKRIYISKNNSVKIVRSNDISKTT